MNLRDFLKAMAPAVVLTMPAYALGCEGENSLKNGLEKVIEKSEREITREEYLGQFKRILGERYKIMQADPIKKVFWQKNWENASYNKLKFIVRFYQSAKRESSKEREEGGLEKKPEKSITAKDAQDILKFDDKERLVYSIIFPWVDFNNPDDVRLIQTYRKDINKAYKKR